MARSIYDYSDPYDLMVGSWTGMTTAYDGKGNYLSSVASEVFVSWVKPGKVLRYHQRELADLDALLEGHPHKASMVQIVNHDFELGVTGPSCKTVGRRKEKVSLQGTATRPGTYLFHLTFPEGDYYNNQYFSSPNERHIIGPFVPTGDSRAFSMAVAQTFTRISYDVPPAEKRKRS
jgi:hypothetical protein